MDNRVVELLLCDVRRSVLGRGAGPIGYSPYGWKTAAGMSVLGFSGELAEQGTGVYSLGNGYRAYSPALMRFYQPDTLSPFAEGGLNAYGYCNADPINRHDPSGAVPEWIAEAQPFATLLLHLVILGASLYTLRNSFAGGGQRLKPLMLAGTSTSVVASTVAITGTTLQLAGVEEGRVVSLVGTLGSAGGVIMRFGGAFLARRAAVRRPNLMVPQPQDPIARADSVRGSIGSAVS